MSGSESFRNFDIKAFDSSLLVGDCEAKTYVNDDFALVKLSGSLNGNNVKKIWRACTKTFCNPNLLDPPYQYPIFDLRDLEYVSPSGLRMFFELGKTYGNVIAAHTTKRVYEIMDTCGLSKVITVLRGAFDIEDIETLPKECQQGSTAKIIAIDEERVLKVFENNYGDYRVEHSAIYEYQNARNSFILGVPCAMPLELVNVDGKLGIVYEKLEKNFYDYLFEDKSKFQERFIEFAEFSRDATKIKVDLDKVQLPDHRDVFFDIKRHVSNTFDIQDIVGPEELNKVHKIMYSFPPQHNYLHGDAFFNNIMFDSWGQKKFIDFSYSGYGHPIWEMIDTYILFSGCRAGMDVINIDTEMSDSIPIDFDERRIAWLNYLRVFAGVEKDEDIEEIEWRVGAMIDCINLMTFSYFSSFLEEEKRVAMVREKFAYVMKHINEFIDRGFRPLPF